MKRFLALILGMACLHTASAIEPATSKEPETSRTMNTISFDDYQDFWTKWKLLTTRYRVDNNEIRATYANDIALKAITEGKTDFPNGATFGKVVWTVASDPTYPNSLQPEQVKRFTFMVKDANHAEHRGWRYAIFDPSGKTLPGDKVQMVNACAKCHEYAANRGFVFLGSMDPTASMLAHKNAKAQEQQLTPNVAGLVDMQVVPASTAPSRLQKLLPSNTDKVVRIGANMAQISFTGIADELVPLEINASLSSNRPAAWWDQHGRVFSLVLPTTANDKCMLPGGTTPGKLFTAIQMFDAGNYVSTIERKVCR